MLRQQLIRELRQSLGAESVHRAGDMVAQFRLRPGRAGRDGRPIPRRAGRDGAVEHGFRGCGDGEAARRQPCVGGGGRSTVRRRGRRPRCRWVDGTLADDLASVVKLLRREPRWPGIWPTRPAIPPPRWRWSGGCCRARCPIRVLEVARYRCVAAVVVELRSCLRDPAHRQAGAAGPRRARRPDRGRRGPAVPVQPDTRLRAAADHAAERLHRSARWPNRVAEQRACAKGE